MFKYDESSSIGNIAVPVLVVPGDRDPVLLPLASDHIASIVPDAQTAVLKRAKHIGLLEWHAQFDAVVVAFIDERATARARAPVV